MDKSCAIGRGWIGRAAILLVAAMIAAALAGCASGGAGGQSSGAAETGAEASGSSSSRASLADFEAVTLDGGKFGPSDIAAHDLTLVYCWQTTCGPCLNKMDEINAFSASLPDNINLISMCFDAASQPDVAARFEGTTITQGDGGLLKVAQEVQYTPTVLMFDSTGKQVGEPIIGVPGNLEAAYTETINSALSEMGLPGLSG